MAGITPEEGEIVILDLLYKSISTNRGTSLVLGLFTNASGLSETSNWSDITQPTGSPLNGYAEKTLTDATWTVAASPPQGS